MFPYLFDSIVFFFRRHRFRRIRRWASWLKDEIEHSELTEDHKAAQVSKIQKQVEEASREFTRF